MNRSTTVFQPIRFALGALLLALGCAIAAPATSLSSRAYADEAADRSVVPPTPADAFVVPPGQEELLGNMLGQKATLPGQCQFTDGQINGPIITGTYTCPTGQVVIEFRHPQNASADAAHTEKFALVVKSGTPPAGLTDALLANIRAQEAQFKWLSLLPPRPPSRGLLRTLIPVLGVAAVIFVLRRMRRARRTP